jgi:hypothetical protein
MGFMLGVGAPMLDLLRVYSGIESEKVSIELYCGKLDIS